ncbi:MAG TPA: hypothetical protein VF265_07160 [Nevskiaceae bacterium]
MTARPPDSGESAWRRIKRQTLGPALAILVCVGGGLIGAWGLPRLVIAMAPHAPTLVVYGSTVVGVFVGAAAGIFLAQIISTHAARRS